LENWRVAEGLFVVDDAAQSFGATYAAAGWAPWPMPHDQFLSGKTMAATAMGRDFHRWTTTLQHPDAAFASMARVSTSMTTFGLG